MPLIGDPREALQEPSTSNWVSSLKARSAYGMPRDNFTKFRQIAHEKHLQIDVRPTNPTAAEWLEQGKLPKPKEIKAKSITPLDGYIGGPDRIGLIGYFQPVMPERGTLDDATWSGVQARFAQRNEEFAVLAPVMAKLAADGKFKVENGIVFGRNEHEDWLELTGDHDVFDVSTARGTRLKGSEYENVMQAMMENDMAVMHGAHMHWDASSPFSTQIFKKIVESHQEGGEPLLRFGPHVNEAELVYARPVVQPHLRPHPDTVLPPGRARTEEFPWSTSAFKQKQQFWADQSQGDQSAAQDPSPRTPVRGLPDYDARRQVFKSADSENPDLENPDRSQPVPGGDEASGPDTEPAAPHTVADALEPARTPAENPHNRPPHTAPVTEPESRYLPPAMTGPLSDSEPAATIVGPRPWSEPRWITVRPGTSDDEHTRHPLRPEPQPLAGTNPPPAVRHEPRLGDAETVGGDRRPAPEPEHTRQDDQTTTTQAHPDPTEQRPRVVEPEADGDPHTPAEDPALAGDQSVLAHVAPPGPSADPGHRHLRSLAGIKIVEGPGPGAVRALRERILQTLPERHRNDEQVLHMLDAELNEPRLRAMHKEMIDGWNLRIWAGNVPYDVVLRARPQGWRPTADATTPNANDGEGFERTVEFKPKAEPDKTSRTTSKSGLDLGATSVNPDPVRPLLGLATPLSVKLGGALYMADTSEKNTTEATATTTFTSPTDRRVSSFHYDVTVDGPSGRLRSPSDEAITYDVTAEIAHVQADPSNRSNNRPVVPSGRPLDITGLNAVRDHVFEHVLTEAEGRYGTVRKDVREFLSPQNILNRLDVATTWGRLTSKELALPGSRKAWLELRLQRGDLSAVEGTISDKQTLNSKSTAEHADDRINISSWSLGLSGGAAFQTWKNEPPISPTGHSSPADTPTVPACST